MGSRFVWFDLTTPEVAAAKRFYGDTLGWKTRKWPGGDYEMWLAGNDEVGGVMPPPAGDSGAHWMGYVSTQSVDAAARQVQTLGGRIVAPAMDIPEVGRMAVVADPQGAIFALFTPQGDGTPPDTSRLGHFSWAELNTTDWKSAWKFYSTLFGWQPTQSMNVGGEVGEYFMFGADPKQSFGGMSNVAKAMGMPPHWIFYVNVEDADETAKVIAQKGGKVLNGPMDIPGGDRIAQCMDPQGGIFAIYSSGE